METIRFTVEGMVNSFRRIETASFQNTELTPKKTHIAGLLTNIMGKTEKFYYSFLPKLKVAVLPTGIEDIFVDMWQYKKWKSSNYGRAVVNREKLYRAKYEIYLVVPDELKEEVHTALSYPQRSPSLGMDDELVSIGGVRYVDVEPKELNKEKVNVHSIFPEDWVTDYSFHPGKDALVIPPRTSVSNLEFEMGPPRKAKQVMRIVEFFGGYCSVAPKDRLKVYFAGDKNVVVW